MPPPPKKNKKNNGWVCLFGDSELSGSLCGLFIASVHCFVSIGHFDGKLFINWIAPATCSFFLAKTTRSGQEAVCCPPATQMKISDSIALSLSCKYDWWRLEIQLVSWQVELKLEQRDPWWLVNFSMNISAILRLSFLVNINLLFPIKCHKFHLIFWAQICKGEW